MPDPEATDLRSLRPEGPALNATALRSTKAGLVALFLVSFALATFGPWYNVLLGYGLMILSMAVAVVGLWWADRSAREAHRDRAMTNGIDARSGAALSLVALILGMYYIGFFFVILVFWPLWFVALLLTWAFHRAWIDSDAASEVHA